MEKKQLKIFISYAHNDKAYFDVFKKMLETHLFTSRKYDFGTWDDSKIYEGTYWDDEIQNELNKSNIAILCVSANFLNSRYIKENEFQVLIKRFADVLILPIYFNHCKINAWDGLSELQYFKPTGDRYDKGSDSDFAFSDLVLFNQRDGYPIPNAKIDLYLKDFVERLESNLDYKFSNIANVDKDESGYKSFVPKTSNKFVGRVNDLQKIEMAFREESIISIEGLGGIGKTEFVTKFIEQIEQSKIVWYDGNNGSSFEALVEAAGFRELLKIENKSGLAFFMGFRELLEKHEKLIVIDNYHEILDLRFNSFLEFNKRGFVKSKIILISRSKLFIEGVDLFHFLLDGLSTDSIAFAKNILKRNSSNSIVITDQKLNEICNDLNGHPFAIQIAMQLLAYEETDEHILKIIKSYSNEREKLSSKLLGEVFNHPKSSESEKSLLLSLSVYRKSFSLRAIEYSFGNEYRDTLKSLIDKLLIERRGVNYAIHSIAREFVYEKINDPSVVHLRAAEYYLSNEDINNLSDFEELFYHLKLSNQSDKLVEVIEQKGEFMLAIGYTKLLEQEIKWLIAKGYESVTLYILLSDLSVISDSNLKKSVDYAQKAICLNSSDSFGNLEAEITYTEGLLKLGRLEEPMKVFKKLLNSCETKKFNKGICICKSYVGQFLSEMNQSNEAERVLKSACKLSLDTKYGAGIRHCYISLALHYIRQKKYKLALQCYNEISVFFSSYENSRARFDALMGNAIVFSHLEKYEDSFRLFQQCLDYYKQVGDKKREADTWFNMGSCLYRKENPDEYKSCVYEGLKIYEAIEDFEGMGNCNAFLGEYEFDKNNFSEALYFHFLSFAFFKKVLLYYDLKKVCEEIKRKVGIEKYRKLFSDVIIQFDKKDQELIKQEGVSLISAVTSKKYERNDKVRVVYSDGTVVVDKFKKLEEDIKNGICIISE